MARAILAADASFASRKDLSARWAARGGCRNSMAEHGRRIKKSLETRDWQQAAERRDAFEALKGIGMTPFFSGGVHRLAEFATRYLAEASHLAPTTWEDRNLILRPEGPVLRLLGTTRLDALTPALLREWWNAEVAARGRSTKTGRSYLDAQLARGARGPVCVCWQPAPQLHRRQARAWEGSGAASIGSTTRTEAVRRS